MPTTPTITEADILADIIGPDQAGLSPEAAQSFLGLKFSPVATKHIRRLLQKNNKGKITAEERATLDKYLRVGQFIDLMQAKARLSLKEAAGNH